MKIAIVQMMYPKGHRLLDEKFVKLIMQFSDVIIIDDGKYFQFENLPKNKVQHFIVHPVFSKRVEPIKRLCHLINLLQVYLVLRKIDVQNILFMSIHTSVYKWIQLFYHKYHITVIHHNDIDRTLCNQKDLRQFNKKANYIKHIVLAEFIKEGLLNNTKVSKENVYVVNQPLLKPIDKTLLSTHNKNVIVAMGSNNDTEWVKKIIEEDESNSKRSMINRMILRHPVISYKSANIQTLKGYLPRETFDDYMSTSKACIVIYPETYKLRYSGIIDDALAHGLKVFCNDIIVGQYYAHKYPNNCHLFRNVSELFKLADSHISEIDKKELNEFEFTHSDSYVLYQLNRVYPLI